MFLTLDDYRSVCDDYEFKQITRNDDIRLTAEAAAMEQIASTSGTAMTSTARVCSCRGLAAIPCWCSAP